MGLEHVLNGNFFSDTTPMHTRYDAPIAYIKDVPTLLYRVQVGEILMKGKKISGVAVVINKQSFGKPGYYQ